MVAAAENHRRSVCDLSMLIAANQVVELPQI